jgi:hypothetical protein
MPKTPDRQDCNPVHSPASSILPRHASSSASTYISTPWVSTSSGRGIGGISLPRMCRILPRSVRDSSSHGSARKTYVTFHSYSYNTTRVLRPHLAANVHIRHVRLPHPMRSEPGCRGSQPGSGEVSGRANCEDSASLPPTARGSRAPYLPVCSRFLHCLSDVPQLDVPRLYNVFASQRLGVSGRSVTKPILSDYALSGFSQLQWEIAGREAWVHASCPASLNRVSGVAEPR